MPVKNICESKVAYDTEFEATRAAAIAEDSFKAPMKIYKCNYHYHIANAIKKLRSKQRPFNRTYCEACSAYMKPQRWESHVSRPGHQAATRRLQRAS